jgi:N-formylglutamate amidohydrolase
MLVALLALCLPAQAQEPKAQPGDLVRTQEGMLPIIISAPHGGLAPIPGVPERKGEGLVTGPSGFVTSRDFGTEELARAIAGAVETKLGNKPYLVAARFHRKFIDPNRPAGIAYESPQAKPVYDHYHDTLARYCRDVQKSNGRGLLIDVHGQGSAADTIFRGTSNGKTVTLLVQRFGPKAQHGPDSFFGLLAAAGCKVHPTKADQKEQAGYTGGYIVQTYGSHTAYGIDAIQLELGSDYRSKKNQPDTAARIATAVAEYAQRYLR